MKKYLLLILCLVSSLIASAESGTCGDNLTWELEDGLLVISGTGAMTNYSYSSNVPWYSSRSTISLAIISEGVTSIGNYAFAGCSGLTSIILPNSVTSIGNFAFKGCSGLTSITIPDGVTSIGNDAFYDCSGLTSVNISDLSSWCNIDFGNNAANPTYYAYKLVLNGTEIKDLVIPDGITEVKDYAFYGCFGLTSITIPNSVTSIGEYAFKYCSGLTSVTIGNSVTSIGREAFYNCSRLTSITIPNSVTSIGYRAFFNCSGLTSITFPNSVTSIGYDAFYNCSGLTSVNISDLSSWCNVYFGNDDANPTIYAHKLVLNGTEIKDLVIPDGITAVESYAFSGCSGLTSITIPNSVTSIGDYAFDGCRGLTSVTIPNSVTSIGGAAFYECSGLTSVSVLAATPPTAGSDMLYYAGTSTIHVYEGLADTYKAASAWRYFTIVDDIPVTRVTGMTLDATRYQCGVGKRFTPQVVTYMPDDATFKEVTWSSSDPTVLTIVASTGACIGLKDGIATITATAKDAGHATVSATVYVGNVNPEDAVTISASSANAEMGTVSGGGTFLPGTTVNLTATPALGYVFERWSDGSTENPYTLEATEGKELVAYFRSTWVTISASSANEQMGSVSGDGTFLPGTTVTLTATPERGFAFQSWSDGSTENPYTFTATESKTLVANFVQKPKHYIKHVRSGLFLKFDPTANENAKVNVLSLANEGSKFTFESTANGTSIYCDEVGEYLTTSGTYGWNPGHSSSPSYWQIEEAAGVTGGYYIKKNSSSYCAPDGTIVGEYIYTNKSVDNTNGTVFEFIPVIPPSEFEISASCNVEQGTVSGSGIYERDTEVTLTATPAEGYKFIRWSDGSTENPYTFIATKNKTLTAEFKLVEMDLTDGTVYNNTAEVTYDYVSYTRTYNNTNWQALYVPFQMSYEDWCDEFEVAQINMFHQYDRNDDGTPDDMEMEIFKVKSGTLKPNHPYLIKSLTTGEKTITLEDATLFAAENNSYSCSSMNTNYTFTGTYAGVSGADMYTNHYYSMGGGSLIYAEDTEANLKPYRWYLKLTDREGQVIPAPSQIRVMEWNGQTTGVESLSLDNAPARALTLDGRCVKDMKARGLYIVNGKKVLR